MTHVARGGGVIAESQVTAPGRAQFVGRQDELRLLLDSVTRAPAAGLVTVVVSGEAGIGKSRLLAEASACLSDRGWRVLTVRADRLERQVPYAALGAALRAVAADNTFTRDVRSAALATLELPALDPVGPESALPPGAAFGRACAAVARLFTALGATGPLAVVVDDLHELDDDSLALLTVVLRRLASAPIGLLTAVRSHLAAPAVAAEETLERLADSVDLVRVDLGTLARAELAAVIAPVLGADPDDHLVDEVHRRADGNPFFATEIARSLAETGMVALDGDRAHLTVESRGIRLTRRTAVLRRVVPLAPDARAVARTLAVLRTVGLERIGLIAEVASLPEATVAAAFDDLVRAHVVTHDADHRYRFSHRIVGEALYDDIGPAECRRLHRLVADRLLAARGRGEAVELLELAWHLSESAMPGEPAAVEVLAEAAHHVLSRAPEAAAGYCGRALALLGEDAPERPGLLALQCRALARASRPAAAVPPGRAALALLPAGDERSRTATAMIGSLFWLGRIEDAIEVADQQVKAGSAPAALHAQRAVLLVFADRTPEALAEAAVAASAVPASPAEEVVVSSQLAMLSSMLLRHTETVDFADRALRASGESTTLRMQALTVCGWTEALAGLVPEAARRLRLAERLAGETDAGHAFSGELGLTRVLLHWFGGRWSTALEGMRTVAAELEARQLSLLAPALTTVELEMRTWRGELALAERLAARPAPGARNMASLHAWAVAGYLAARGDVAGARRTLSAAADDPVTATYGCLLLGRLAELDLEHGRTGDAERALGRLVDVVTPQFSPWGKAVLHLVAGLVHRDGEELARAVREAELAGLVFDKARAQLALGEVAADASPGLVEAYHTFARLGAHGLRRRAGRRLQALGQKVPRTRSRAPGLLTESEERVARLVQQGMRNREVAAALHYSPRSVEVYLSRIYAKLRVSSRLELARVLDAMDARG